ncbi:MAG: hypothetical protein WCT31_03425 [Candidatus Micrarchaeia archaeon]|jgi:hypothetical protein
MEFDLIFYIGFFGAAIQLIAYALHLRDKLHHHSMAYLLANAGGCCMTMTYAFVNQDIPFFMLEVTWGAFAIHKLYEIKIKKKTNDKNKKKGITQKKK